MSGMANPHAGAMGGVPNPHTSEVGGAEKPVVTKAVDAATTAETHLKANPNDPTLRKQAADADFQAGVQMTTQSDQPRSVKYRVALQYFRRTVALDPSNKDAAGWIDTIESIYKSLGRPIPK